MYFETVVWYNPGNRFALIKPSDGHRPYLVQLTPQQAIDAPLKEGQRFEERFEIDQYGAESVTTAPSSQGNHA